MTEENVMTVENISLLGKVKIFFTNRIIIYTIRRLLVMIPLFFGVSLITFSMSKLIGDPTDQLLGLGRGREVALKLIREQYGLDQPLHIQYFKWLENFVTWKFGYSGIYKLKDPSPIIDELMYQTAKMQYSAIFLALAIAIPLGIIAARNRGSNLDSFVSGIALLGLSMPIFVSGILLIIIFGGGGLNWFPVAGANTPHRVEVDWSVFFQNFDHQWSLLWTNIADSNLHLTLPLIALTFAFLALNTRLVRSNMLEVLNQDYILAARANGIKERTIIWRHALRNAILPVVTFVGLSIGAALGGAPITETVFGWPGLGKAYITAILLLDMSLVLGITMIITLLILFSNLITDLLYVVIDPRITI